MISTFGVKIVIEPEKTPDMSPGGIALPDNAQRKFAIGKVLAVGRGESYGGEVHKLDVKAGDRVAYDKYASSDLEVSGKKYQVCRYADLMAKL
jgi:chaperonin GroES